MYIHVVLNLHCSVKYTLSEFVHNFYILKVSEMNNITEFRSSINMMHEERVKGLTSTIAKMIAITPTAIPTGSKLSSSFSRHP